ncbi:hypothetical protein NQ117_16160 [Paenibacillus sp. SC116]|uniref:hypothetical protein n=1 Tax=Paenibacillus sp. SC116 TaxID=2968986 RepID=UPI00215AA6E0|nr:hypothetical protein [Paenibacillus sp. SC116]MCR8845219.1 hypothetical protein [Paenibacillus sp. SC116]
MLRNLFDRGLWWKEFRQARLMLIVMLVVGFFALPYTHIRYWFMMESGQIYGEFMYIIEALQETPAGLWVVRNLLSSFLSTMIVMSLVLAIFQLGLERHAHRQEFSFSLPYSRSQIYITKLLIGITIIVIPILINVLLDIVMLFALDFSFMMMWEEYAKYIVKLLLLVISAYTIGMFVGTISGSLVAHIVFIFVVIYYPEFIKWSFRTVSHLYDISILKNYNDYPLTTYFFDMRYNSYISLYVLLAAIVLGIIHYSLNRAEHNGKWVVVPIWEKILIIGFTISSGLFFGVYVQFQHYSGQIGYGIGFVLGLVLGYVMIKLLNRLRLRF